MAEELVQAVVNSVNESFVMSGTRVRTLISAHPTLTTEQVHRILRAYLLPDYQPGKVGIDHGLTRVEGINQLRGDYNGHSEAFIRQYFCSITDVDLEKEFCNNYPEAGKWRKRLKLRMLQQFYSAPI